MLRRCLVLALLSVTVSVAAFGAQRPAILRPTVFAIRDARVIVEPGKVLPQATVVVRDGLIEAVGEVKPPADALVIEGKGLTVYPGFIDAMSNWGFDQAQRRSEIGSSAVEDSASESLATTKPDNRKGMTPEFEVSTALKSEEEQAEAWRRVGITAHLVAPEGGIFTGQSSLISLSDLPSRESILRTPVAMHSAFRLDGGNNEYPRVLMGVIAHTRQTLLDAGHYRRAWAEFERSENPGRRPPHDQALAALASVLGGKMPVVFEADSRDEINRALDFAAEFNLKPILFGARDAAKTVDRLKQAQVPVLLRVNFSDQPTGRMGRRAGMKPIPGKPTPGRPTPPIDPAVPPIGDDSEKEKEKAQPKRVLDDRQRLNKEEMATASVLHKNGVPFAFSTQGPPAAQAAEKFRENLRKAIAEGLPPEAALNALTAGAAKLLGVEKQLGTVSVGKSAHLVVTDGDFHEAKTKIRYVFADGVRFDLTTPAEPSKPDLKKAEEAKKPEKPKEDKAGPEQKTELETDRKPKLKTGGNVLIQNATVLTVTNGVLTGSDILVKSGKIAQIGPNLAAPDGVTRIDAAGLFVMPGIIDTHCHFAVAGSVNEFSLSVVPEVRIRDVLDGEDVQIYRALAGGVTTSRLLHGSANVVGGQDAVIKLKYGQPASQLLMADAPRGVKFALGENVKRTSGRFPNTRLGVEAVLIRAFTDAQAYQKQWDEYKQAQGSGRPAVEPRRDLRLEALADILRGDLKVHCHCYRSDEILMLLRVADRFGFKIKSLQHVLEGYKIASEIADHGASCSTFSDWWAYKIEAYDAIPYNSALLHEAGAVVCLKSDDSELMRHMYQEAAKCVKYGGMSEVDALKAITLNGAKQLSLDGRLGSIEVGKDADLAIFNGHPLNSYSRVEMTLVEGEVYFQRSEKPTPLAEAAPPPAKPTNGFKTIQRNPTGTYAIQNVTAHTVTNGKQENTTLIVDKGRIAALGAKVNAPTNATVIDGTGLHIYPGMIDAATVLGLTELGSARETQDYAEGGDFQPDLRAGIGINPDSELIPVTRANGVTTVVTRPTGAIIAGQSALINLSGWVPKEMALVESLALHVEFPTAFPTFGTDPSLPMLGRTVMRKQREEKIRRVHELFAQAIAYDEARKQTPDKPVNPRLESLVPYARGQRPVIVQASRKQEILDALKLASDLKWKMILSGGIDAWKVADELKKRDVPVIVGPIMALPQETYDPFDAPYSCPRKLHEAGVRFCIRSAGATNTRNLPYEAAMAISYGLPVDEGLKAVTLYPAQILGVADQLGSLETGKRANLVLTNGDLLQASTQVQALFIDGRPLEPTSKQTKLYERYRERLREVKDGRAPLGTK